MIIDMPENISEESKRIIRENPLRDIRCTMVSSTKFQISGDSHIGEDNNYKPIKHVMNLDINGLVRLQHEIADAIASALVHKK